MTDLKDDPQRRNLVWLCLQMFCRTVFAIWFRYRVRGLEHVPEQGAALLLSNHQSFLDPLFIPLWMYRPVSFLARDTLFGVPIVGWVLRHTYVIPIDRDSPKKSSLRASIDRLDSGFLLGVFPEGTRTTDGAVDEFRPGFLTILRRCEVPILPVGIAGADKAMPRGRALIRPFAVRVVIGPPLGPEEWKQPKGQQTNEQIVSLVRSRVLDCQAEAERWRTGQ